MLRTEIKPLYETTKMFSTQFEKMPLFNSNNCNKVKPKDNFTPLEIYVCIFLQIIKFKFSTSNNPALLANPRPPRPESSALPRRGGLGFEFNQLHCFRLIILTVS